MKKIVSLLLSLFLLSCSDPEVKKNNEITEQKNSPIKMYSKEAKDTFYISVSLPNDTGTAKLAAYPVIYLLDGTFYFDVMSPTFHRYAEVGLLPRAILVGIGYKDLGSLDTLRDRDLTYPKAIPEYEMDLSGNGDKFLSFIDNELVPYIDKNYPTDTAKRVLMGHSLGGYFTLFALQQHMIKKDHTFFSYIAASPSTDYNHNYILNEFDKLKGDHSDFRAYVTFGGMEDQEEPDDTAALKCNVVLSRLKASLKENNKLNYGGEIFSGLNHMDTGFPTFVRGIQMSFIND